MGGNSGLSGDRVLFCCCLEGRNNSFSVYQVKIVALSRGVEEEEDEVEVEWQLFKH